MLRHFFIFCFWSCTQCIAAEHATEALKYYKNGDYSKAIELWEKELKTESCNKELAYFALGNAHFKNKSYAEALVHYERSLRENYNQEEVKFNIKVVRAKLGLDTENKILFTHDIVRRISYFFSDFTLKCLLIIFGIALLAYSTYRYFRGDSKLGYLKNYMLTIAFSLIGLHLLQNYFKNESDKAIIAVESTGFANVNLKGESKTIREGEQVIVLDEVGEAIQVETEANKNYWIQKSNIISI